MFVVLIFLSKESYTVGKLVYSPFLNGGTFVCYIFLANSRPLIFAVAGDFNVELLELQVLTIGTWTAGSWAQKCGEDGVLVAKKKKNLVVREISI